MEITLEKKTLKLPKHLRLISLGASGSGKSTFFKNILKHRRTLLSTIYKGIIYCSPNYAFHKITEKDKEFQEEIKKYTEGLKVVFIDYLPTIEQLEEIKPDPNDPYLIIIDDFEELAYTSPIILNIFTRLSTHYNLDVMLSVHTSNTDGKKNFFQTLLQNSNAIILFDAFLSAPSISKIGLMLFRGKKHFLLRTMNSLAKFVNYNHAYLAILTERNYFNSRFPIRSNIFAFTEDSFEKNMGYLFIEHPDYKKL